MDLVRTTEAAAMAASRWMGRGDKLGADGAAVEAMRTVLSSVPMDGIVVIGEGEKDNAPMLFNGEKIGDGTPPLTDIAVDPIDGTTLTAQGRGGATSPWIAGGRAGSHVRPGSVCLHGEAGRGPPGPRAPATSDARRPRTSTPRRRPSVARCVTSPRSSSTGPVTTPSSPRCGPPEPGSASSPTATWPVRSPPAGPGRARTSSSASGARPRACWPRPLSSAWARRSRAGSTPATSRSGRRRSRRATPSTPC